MKIDFNDVKLIEKKEVYIKSFNFKMTHLIFEGALKLRLEIPVLRHDDYNIGKRYDLNLLLRESEFQYE